MSSRTKNWNLKPGHNSYMPKRVRDRLREERRKHMEYRREHGWTSQNVFRSLYFREKIEKAIEDAKKEARAAADK